MIATFLSKSGKKSASCNNINLHSPYNPEREAERFIRRRISSPPITVLLLGPALNYISTSFIKLYPGVRVISIYYHKYFFEADNGLSASSALYTDDSALHSFLQSNIDEFDLEGLSIVEWPPSANIFKQASERVNTVVKSFFEQLYAGFLTTEYFGRRWIKNSIKNYLFHHNIVSDFTIRKPVLITASGPSLEKSLHFIQKHESKLYIAALPSSVQFLNENSIHIDLVIATDAGFYSSYHNNQILNISSGKPLLAKSVTARFDPFLSHLPAYIFGSSDSYEAYFLLSLFNNPRFTPSNGTVAGTAFDLILSKKPPYIIFAGLDFSYLDILSHARPHPFYTDFLSVSNRLTPFNSILFSRHLTFSSTSKAFSTFASWFNLRASSIQIPLYRLNPSDIPIDGMIPIDETAAEKFFSDLSEASTFEDTLTHGAETKEKKRKIYTLIETWIASIKPIYEKNNIRCFDDLKKNVTIFVLLHFSNPLLLKKIKKLYRLGKTELADRTVAECAKDTVAFLKTLLLWC
jgi:hypothetical protein